GVAVAGGRRTLMADIDYTVDASGGVVVRNADAIIGPLATLSRVAQIAPERPETNAVASESANVQPGPPSAYPGRPSFDCSKAQSRGEIAVCADSGLSALDRNVAAQYWRARAHASPEQQAQLQQTSKRFHDYRDHCPDRTCIAD